jgi:hypothetical protein
MVLGQSKKSRVSVEEINKQIPNDSFLTAIKHIPGTFYNEGAFRSLTLFMCKCGKETKSYYRTVTCGRKKSCGCLIGGGYRRNAKYNYFGSEKLRRAYYTMINRCYSENDSAYEWYGGRGVRVCKEWRDNPQSFFDWGKDEGVVIGMTLDKDIKGGGMLYSPETCCWVTHKVNCQNRRPKGSNKNI